MGLIDLLYTNNKGCRLARTVRKLRLDRSALDPFTSVRLFFRTSLRSSLLSNAELMTKVASTESIRPLDFSPLGGYPFIYIERVI